MKRDHIVYKHPNKAGILIAVFCMFLATLPAADFFIHRHEEIPLAQIPGFHALFAVISCVVMILLARLLRFFVKRIP